MAENESQEQRQAYQRADKIVAERIGLFRHLAIYMVVNVFLFVINLVTSSEFLWFLFILGGWGIGLFAHFLSVFAFGGGRIERWRRREIEKEMQKLRKKD